MRGRAYWALKLRVQKKRWTRRLAEINEPRCLVVDGKPEPA